MGYDIFVIAFFFFIRKNIFRHLSRNFVYLHFLLLLGKNCWFYAVFVGRFLVIFSNFLLISFEICAIIKLQKEKVFLSAQKNKKA